MTLSRRSFFATAGAAAVATALNSATSQPASAREKSKSGDVKFELGVASYSFRKFDVDQLIQWCRRAEIQKVSLKDFHLPLQATDDECAALAKKFNDAGLEIYSCGVIYMSQEDDVVNAFRYAKALGCVSIVGVPDWNLLPLVEEKVKETNILMAIHNHGPGDKRYPRAASVWERVQNLDPRMGIALDIGHSIRDGEDPVQAVKDFAPRIFDFHFKDMNRAAADGRGVICGRGAIDLPALVRALVEVGYDKVAPFEYEIDENDPFPGFMQSLGYVRGLCASV